jgi:HPt (histidine-containing phosphotransfer) domain-containing protein
MPGGSEPVVDVLDAAVLDSLRQLTQPGEPDLLADVLSLFLTDAPGRLDAIVAAAAEGDAAALHRSAHTLKGAAGAIGATALQLACRELEELAKRPGVAPGSADLATLHSEFARVKTAIDLLL